MIKPSREEIREYMELHNGDEVGIGNEWSMEEAEYYLLLEDKYYYCQRCGLPQTMYWCNDCEESFEKNRCDVCGSTLPIDEDYHLNCD